jgi:hypothetical protein
MQVRFIHKANGYNSGEIADFDQAHAQRFVAAGVAVPYRAEPVAEVVDEPAPKKSPVNRKMKARVTK